MTKKITEKGMLVSLSIQRWTARKHDRAVSDKVALDHGAGADAGRYTKALLAKESLAGVSKVAREARAHHYENTLPWTDTGHRILPADNFFKYSDAQAAFKNEFEKEVKKFADNYPSYVSAAQNNLGRMYDATDYPDAGTIAGYFGIDVDVTPLPDGKDFRVDLGVDVQKKIQADIEAKTTGAIQDAAQDLWNRTYEAVKHMADRLKAYDPTDKSKAPFRDTVVTNLRELVDLLPRLNMTGDQNLTDMSDKLAQTLCGANPDELRDDSLLRDSTAEEADAILKDMDGFVN